MGCLLGWVFFLFLVLLLLFLSFSFLSLLHAPALKFFIIIWHRLVSPYARHGSPCHLKNHDCRTCRSARSCIRGVGLGAALPCYHTSCR
jgi:hypothetical protein